MTGTVGTFAKSHIIPDAFMQRVSDAPFMEWGGDGRSKKRFSGWYDQTLMTRDGESLLADYDDYAAQVLMNGGWTYRRRRDPSNPERLVDDFRPEHLYEIEGVDTDRIKLFGLSLLWRAAASDLEAFRRVRLRPETLEHLRQRVRQGQAGKPLDFPVYFTLFDGSSELPKMAPFSVPGHPFYRFFLDGVVCYVGRGRANIWSRRLPQLMVGGTPGRLQALCVASLGSDHDQLSHEMARQLFQKEGDIFRKDYNRAFRKL